RVLFFAPAAPYAVTWVIGVDTVSFFEPIVAEPKTFVGTPSLSGEKPAVVICTVSSARADVAATRQAQQSSAAIGTQAFSFIAPSLLSSAGRGASVTLTLATRE